MEASDASLVNYANAEMKGSGTSTSLNPDTTAKTEMDTSESHTNEATATAHGTRTTSATTQRTQTTGADIITTVATTNETLHSHRTEMAGRKTTPVRNATIR